MKFGEEWLYNWVDPSISSTQICEQLTNFGCEAECIPNKQIYVKNTIIGQVICKQLCSTNKKLIRYTVRVYYDTKIYVLFKDKKYLVVGTKISIILPNLNSKKNTSSVLSNVKKNRLNGTFGSYHLLGIEQNNHDIVIFTHNALIGLNYNHYIHINKYIIKFFIPFNRVDLRSIWGLSREIALLNNLPIPKLKYQDVLLRSHACNNSIDITIKHDYIQYIFCEIHSVQFWSILPIYIQERLRHASMLTDNIIINIINYIFIETGHWFHIFDLDKLNNKLNIYSLEKKEFVRNIHNQKIYLQKGTIVLSDSKNILSFEDMEYSGCCRVSRHTKNLFLGSICFDPMFIQQRCLLAPSIDRQLEYSKYNIYPSLQKNIFQYAQKLITSICGAKSSAFKEYHMKNCISESPVLLLKLEKLNKITGISFFKEDILSILKICRFSFYEDKNIFYVIPPFWRTDIRIVEDVVSEIIRVYGYKKIVSTPPTEYMNIMSNKNKNISLSRIKLFLIDRGYFEIISYSFINSMTHKYFLSDDNIIKICNPISNDMSEMRSSIWINLLNCIAYNQKRQQESIRIFETGLCFFSNKNNCASIIQKEYLSGAMSGFFSRREWYLKNRKVDFYDLKGDIESILNICGKLNHVEFISEKYIGLCPKQSAGIYLSGQLIGRIGVLDVSLHRIFDLKDSVVLFEIMWEKINSSSIIKKKSVSLLPNSKRDISILVSDTILAKDILNVCHDSISIHTSDIYIYDIYTGPNIPFKKKSVSICFIFQSTDIMLHESKISSNILKCIKELKNKLGAVLRD
ncbi:phenylalanine--tRNA ligase subunit beta [Buchnera aphidicola]|uniref:Phenylalanine--tRNA ligase beta subunit n=1 Tax=Buchnera aphidicola (Cinara cf. splendens/pseudotsugae 3390) TaxID=2518980 RepID=A0A451CXH3_9GAMM|nr:phenylalanine--tRNA ligase subunit beta [Buchnera aphidicola]VFP77660.1 Phenylalanine--tRNA ligase beta subunit [Buchnera aphidicola (Cinara cf. splendens/pseudotsugae 3390)]